MYVNIYVKPFHDWKERIKNNAYPQKPMTKIRLNGQRLKLGTRQECLFLSL